MAGRWLYPFRLMDTKRGHMERVDIFHELMGGALRFGDRDTSA